MALVKPRKRADDPFAAYQSPAEGEAPKGKSADPFAAYQTPAEGGPSTPATPAPSPKPSLLQRMGDNFNYSTRHVPTDGVGSVLQNFGAGAGDVLRSIGHAFDAPERHTLAEDYAIAGDNIKHTLSDPVAALASKAGEGAGVLLTAELAKKGAEVARPAAADTLSTTGRGAQSLAAKVANHTIGTVEGDTAYGTDPGRGISRGRIVGATRKSLLDKVNTRAAAATQLRDSAYDAAASRNVDLDVAVKQPFSEVRTRATHPKTGAATPARVASLTRAEDAITQTADPRTGKPVRTAPPKDLTTNTPREAGSLLSNTYGMTDYSTPENTLANEALKRAGGGMRDKLLEAVPEAADLTSQVHDMMGAKEVLDRGVQGEKVGDVSRAGLLSKGRMLAGTGASSLLDRIGSGLRKAGGSLQSAASAGKVADGSRAVPGLPAPGPNTATAERVSGVADLPADAAQDPGQMRMPAPYPSQGRLPAEAGEGQQPPSPPPTLNERAARMRVAPNQFSTPDTVEQGTTTVGPDGSATRNRGLLDTPQGNRRNRILDFQRDTERRAAPNPRAALRDRLADAPVDLYHGTTDMDAIESILRDGLRGNERGGFNPAYLTRDAGVAESYANGVGTGPGERRSGVVLRVPTTRGQMRTSNTHPEELTESHFGGKPYVKQAWGEFDTVNSPHVPASGIDREGSYLVGADGKRGMSLADYVKSKSAVPEPAKADSMPLQGSPKTSKPKLADRLPSAPASASSKVPARLPDPGDVDAWFDLVDEGLAEYDTGSHQFRYTGGKSK